MSLRRLVSSLRSPAGEPRGFVLVGVVMFILVLTILGLSLFSLSGFEAQFMQNSLDTADAFYAAVGGLERAKFALIHGNTLESVTANLPIEGVQYAVARQGPDAADTMGTVAWNGPEVWIRVLATKNGERKLLEARYHPSRTTDLYGRLMTLYGALPQGAGAFDTCLYVQEHSYNPPFEDRSQQTILDGEVWQNNTDTGWALPLSPEPAFVFGGVPLPELDSYFAAHFATAIEADGNGQSHHYTPTGIGKPNDVGFYKSTWTGGDWGLKIDSGPPPVRITVSGIVIWMFDHGFFSQRPVTVEGTVNDMLVMVAKPSTDPNQHNSGISTSSSLDSPNGVPVVLVTSGRVDLEMYEDPDLSATIDFLSIFARNVLIMGPRADPNGNQPQALTLKHPLPGVSHPANATLEKLYDLGLLPNVAPGAGRKLTMEPGTWREVTESNPS